jgi:hypothetical protein
VQPLRLVSDPVLTHERGAVTDHSQNGVREITVNGRTFQAMTAMPAEAFSDFGDLVMDMGEGTFARKAFHRLTDIIRRSLKPDERDRWDKFIEEDLDPPIDIDMLMKTADGLTAAATGRPSQPPTPSGNGEASRPTGSTDVSGSQAEAATTSSPSAPA